MIPCLLVRYQACILLTKKDRNKAFGLISRSHDYARCVTNRQYVSRTGVCRVGDRKRRAEGFDYPNTHRMPDNSHLGYLGYPDISWTPDNSHLGYPDTSSRVVSVQWPHLPENSLHNHMIVTQPLLTTNKVATFSRTQMQVILFWFQCVFSGPSHGLSNLSFCYECVWDEGSVQLCLRRSQHASAYGAYLYIQIVALHKQVSSCIAIYIYIYIYLCMYTRLHAHAQVLALMGSRTNTHICIDIMRAYILTRAHTMHAHGTCRCNRKVRMQA